MDFTRVRDKNNFSAIYETGNRLNSSPMRLRSPNIYSQAVRSTKHIPVFTIERDNKIPDSKDFTQSMYPAGSVDRLLVAPKHKQPSKKFDWQLVNRHNVSYTGEDTEQTTLNLPLSKSLRDGVLNRHPKNLSTAQPPVWYDDDIKNYESKFDLAVKERAQFKRQHFSSKNMSVLNSNSNANWDMDQRHKRGGQVG